MSEIGKEQFGRFVAEQRKKRNLTQKELAQKLYVSDKAVSKWERGSSMPDISLLKPLAETLDVTVTELLEGRKIEEEEAKAVENDKLERLLKKAVTLTKDTPEMRREKKKKNAMFFGICVAIAVLEVLLFHAMGCPFLQAPPVFLLFMLLSLMAGVFLWLLTDDQLPDFYSEYDMRSGMFTAPFPRYHMPGKNITKRNWSHMVKAARKWAVGSLLALPLLYVGLTGFPELLDQELLQVAVVLLYFGTLVVPVMLAGE